jgi:hypothetical protein
MHEGDSGSGEAYLGDGGGQVVAAPLSVIESRDATLTLRLREACVNMPPANSRTGSSAGPWRRAAALGEVRGSASRQGRGSPEGDRAR